LELALAQGALVLRVSLAGQLLEAQVESLPKAQACLDGLSGG